MDKKFQNKLMMILVLIWGTQFAFFVAILLDSFWDWHVRLAFILFWTVVYVTIIVAGYYRNKKILAEEKKK